MDGSTNGGAVDPRISRTREAVGDAVRELLVEEGWDAVTHQRVAERSGYSRNTVYRHFPDRTALISHGGHFDDAVHHHQPTGDLRVDMIGELRTFRTVLFDGVVGTIIASMVERAERDPDTVEMRDRLVAAGAALTFDLVATARAHDRLAPDIVRQGVDDADIVSMLCGPVLYARLCQGRPPSDEMIEAVVDAVLLSTASAQDD